MWLEGDNPLNSTDSRQYGPVPWALLQGRALFKVQPLPQKPGSCPSSMPKRLQASTACKPSLGCHTRLAISPG